MPRTYYLPALSVTAAILCLAAFFLAARGASEAWMDPRTGEFAYVEDSGIDDTLGQIALYLINLNHLEGGSFTSGEIEEGVVGFQIRYFDNGNRTVDRGDWMSIRRYRIPAVPDTNLPAEYYKDSFTEYVDVDLDGINEEDYYFINGKQYELKNLDPKTLGQYQVQIETGINAFLSAVGYGKIMEALGVGSQTSIKKEEAYEDGSLPSRVALGVDLGYVFKPIVRSNRQLSEAQMVTEIRNRIGFAYSAITSYTDVNGYKFREIAEEVQVLQRVYDVSENRSLRLVIDALFDTDGDGLISGENISRGYTRFREIHQKLSESARANNLRLILPNQKLAQLRKEYETVHSKPYKP